MGIGRDLTENSLSPDFYDESEYDHLESVVNWALQELRTSDDRDIIDRAYRVMEQTNEYLEDEYGQTGFKLDMKSSMDGKDAYSFVRDEMREKAHEDFETWNRLENIRYDLKKILEYKED